jgi:putative hydroxymethylpyrimidine transport system substrate-binding protein
MQKSLFTLLCVISFSGIALQKSTLALDWYINPNHVPLVVAQQGGDFKAEGLRVKLISPTSTTTAAQLLAAGRVQFSIMSAYAYWRDKKAGMPFVWVATLMSAPINCVTTLASAHISSLKALQGKTVGYAGSVLGPIFLSHMLAKAGLSLKDITLVNVNMSLSEALLSKKVSAVFGMSRNVEPVALEASGHAVRLFLPEHYGITAHDAFYIVANKNKTSLTLRTAFQKGFAKGMHQSITQPHKAWRIATKAYPDALAPNAKEAALNKAIWKDTWPMLSPHPLVFNKAAYDQLILLAK